MKVRIVLVILFLISSIVPYNPIISPVSACSFGSPVSIDSHLSIYNLDGSLVLNYKLVSDHLGADCQFFGPLAHGSNNQFLLGVALQSASIVSISNGNLHFNDSLSYLEHSPNDLNFQSYTAESAAYYNYNYNIIDTDLNVTSNYRVEIYNRTSDSFKMFNIPVTYLYSGAFENVSGVDYSFHSAINSNGQHFVISLLRTNNYQNGTTSYSSYFYSSMTNTTLTFDAQYIPVEIDPYHPAILATDDSKLLYINFKGSKVIFLSINQSELRGLSLLGSQIIYLESGSWSILDLSSPDLISQPLDLDIQQGILLDSYIVGGALTITSSKSTLPLVSIDVITMILLTTSVYYIRRKRIV